MFTFSCANPRKADVVTYGATSGGIAAAIRSSRMGKSVILREPGTHFGGFQVAPEARD